MTMRETTSDTIAQPSRTTAEYAPGWRMWVPVAVMMTCSCLSYIDRQALAVISPMILKDTGLSVSGYTYAVSAFSIAYMIANPLWGSLLDYVGLRAGMLAAVGIWTLASASHAWVAGFLGFAAARTLLGLGEGATFPGGLRTAAESLPLDRQSRGMGISYGGASLGSIFAPLIIVPIALRHGWRAAFLVTGALGAAWLAVWWLVARPPLLRPVPRVKHRMVWPNMLERRFWLLVVGMGLGGAALGPILYLCPLYLNRVSGLTQKQLGEVLWIPAVCWELGYYFWGWVADRYVRNEARPLKLYAGLAVLALATSMTTWTTSWIAALAFFSWGMFIAVAFIVISLHLSARAYPRAETGMVAGIGSGAWSAVVAILLPIYGRCFDHHWYAGAFISLSVIPAVGTVLWWWIGRSIRQPSTQSA
ncbi:MAG TPA: MFS transporter [Candidatus Acidoferrales bacterium]|jgi:ACS family hexuronate transporter-like MFS transporter|nr:MFS transporter [Candidatus Acidoferrales bacterium]